MNASEKLEQLAKFAKTGEMFEICVHGVWHKRNFFNGYLMGRDISDAPMVSDVQLNGLLIYEIRAILKLPKLTQEEKDWLKWFPQDWWIAKDEDGLIGISDTKPRRGEVFGDRGWYVVVDADDAYYLKYHPPFAGIKWSDEDCFTIGELMENK